MKKYFLLVMLLFLVATSSCFASEDARYVPIKEGENFSYYLDTKSIVFHKNSLGKIDKNRFSAWVKIVYSESGREKEFDRYNLSSKEREKLKNLSYALVLSGFVENERKISFKRELLYDAQKNLIRENKAKEENWVEVSPDSRGEMYLNAASDYIHKQK